MTTSPSLTAPGSLGDLELVTRSVTGDAHAFGLIVERYQSLICALAYSACGDIHVSEDLAQETFVSAWRQLRDLREPGKLRSWLCGIARNVIHNFLRRQQRTPTARADALDDATETCTDALSPADGAMRRQEEAILWRTLQNLPVHYREPMVLYYRQQESVAAVAESLGLSQDAVKQRLSRGRDLLAEQVKRLLGNVLRDSGPSRAFTLGVVAALPAMAVSSCAAGLGVTAAKGSATAKAAGAMGWCSALLSPVLVFTGMWFGYKMGIENARSEEERKFVIRFHRWLLACILVFGMALLVLALFSRLLVRANPWLFAALTIGLVAAYAAVVLGLVLWSSRIRRSLLLQEAGGALTPLASRLARPRYEYRSKVEFLGLPLVHIRFGREVGEAFRPVKAWIAIGDAALGGLFAFGGLAVAPFSMGGVAVGLVSFGGCAMGWLCWGGFALGMWAIGGFAVGYLALGGCALGWKAAVGGLALAHHYAEGGAAVALHANDAVERAFIHSDKFFHFANTLMAYAVWLNLLWVLPMAWMWWKLRVRRDQGKP